MTNVTKREGGKILSSLRGLSVAVGRARNGPLGALIVRFDVICHIISSIAEFLLVTASSQRVVKSTSDAMARYAIMAQLQFALVVVIACAVAVAADNERIKHVQPTKERKLVGEYFNLRMYWIHVAGKHK
jgi:hypothetical protein